MFNLDQTISEWRRQMLAAGIKTPVPLEELESHLRDEIEQQTKSGLTEAEAFEAAAQKIGQAHVVQNEFKKVEKTNPKGMRRKNIALLFGVGMVLIINIVDLALKKLFHINHSLEWPPTVTLFIILFIICFVVLVQKKLMDRQTKDAMKFSQSTWSPFQSREVREICAHLMPDEHAQLIANARQRGIEIWRLIGVPSGITTALLVWSWQVGLVLLAMFVVYFLVSGLPRIRGMRRRSIEFLCETEWARSRGYTPERLRLETFPWQDERPSA